VSGLGYVATKIRAGVGTGVAAAADDREPREVMVPAERVTGNCVVGNPPTRTR
jgi:hypothetical protein